VSHLNRKGPLAVSVAMVALTASVLAIAQGALTIPKSAAEAAAAVDARKAHFKDIKKAYDPIIAMLKRQREIDPAVVATSAAQIQELAAKIPALFTVDTRQFKDIKTDSLDSIWTNQADYKAKSDDLSAAAANAAVVARGDDKGASMKAFSGIGKACSGCHDSYKFKT
jgi:cytochrome c556